MKDEQELTLDAPRESAGPLLSGKPVRPLTDAQLQIALRPSNAWFASYTLAKQLKREEKATQNRAASKFWKRKTKRH